MEISIQVDTESEKVVSKLAELNVEVLGVFSGKGFDGFSDAITIVVSLGSISLPLIASIVKELIRSRRYVKVIHEGVEITGLSEKSTFKVLKEILESQPLTERPNEGEKENGQG